MRALLLIILSVFVGNIATSQVTLSVITEGGNSIPGVKIIARSVGDTNNVLKGISNAEGNVKFGSTKGVYLVKTISYGYADFEDSLDLTSNKIITLLELQEFGEVCVTAQYRPTSIENAVQKITIIGVEQIRQSGANNLSEILGYQTGIRIAQDNVLGSSMDLSGISGQNVKILIDGVPVIGRLNGDIDLSQISLNNIERIEIIEGPLSVNYGTNALAGTINVITKKDGNEGVTVEVNPYYESIGNYNLTGSVTYNRCKHTIILDGGRNYFDGWTDGDLFIEFPKEKLADTNRVKTWKPKEQFFGGARYHYSTDNFRFSFFGKYFDELIINRGMPIAPYFEAAFDDYYRTKRLDVGFTADNDMKKGKLNTIIAYNDYNRTKNTYYKDLTNLEEVLSQTDGAQDTSEFNQASGRFIYSNNVLKKLNIQIGGDLNYTNAFGRRIKEGQQDLGDYAGFIIAEWKPFNSLTINPGVRYAYNTRYESPLIPSLNVLYRYKKYAMRASVARGFRAPDLKELYMDFVDINHNIQGNPDLQAENSWNYALYINRMVTTKNNTFVKVEYGVYYNEISHLIALGVTETNSYSYINIGKYNTIGQQLTVNYRRSDFNAAINTAYIGRYNPDSEMADVPVYSFSPEVGGKFSYSFFKNKIKANVFYKFNGQLQRFDITEDDEMETSLQSSYSILDASITSFFLKQKNLSITAGAKNILNVKQVNISGQSQGGVHSSPGDLNAGRGVSIFISIHYSIHSNSKCDEK